MQLALHTPYVDVRAADLVLRLDGPRATTLGTRTVRLAGFEIDLGLLGHSHQVRVRGEDLRLSETVACHPGLPGDLPERHDQVRGTHRYVFTAGIEPLAAAAGRRIAAEVAADAHGIVGLFPGDPDAFTALRARALSGGVTWETWHAYPQTGELVRTAGRLEVAA